MTKKFVAGCILVCIVLVAATVFPVEADDGRFSSCFKNCEQECQADGRGSSFCEMKCDADCGAKEAAAKLNINL
ncbi:hypothetical protein DITRI_Ditri13aG0092500 [Diplodiscus trichospermus]